MPHIHLDKGVPLEPNLSGPPSAFQQCWPLASIACPSFSLWFIKIWQSASHRPKSRMACNFTRFNFGAKQKSELQNFVLGGHPNLYIRFLSVHYSLNMWKKCIFNLHIFIGVPGFVLLTHGHVNFGQKFLFGKSVLLWQDICWGYPAILVQNSLCADSCSRLHIRLHYKGAHDRREPSSCMIVGVSISYHSMKQCRILRENLNKFSAKAIQGYNSWSLLVFWHQTIEIGKQQSKLVKETKNVLHFWLRHTGITVVQHWFCYPHAY